MTAPPVVDALRRDLAGLAGRLPALAGRLPALARPPAPDLLVGTAGLVAGLLVAGWWLTAPDAWWSDPTVAARTLSELAGLCGVVLLLGCLLLTARLEPLEQAYGLPALLAAHRRAAPPALVLVVVHVVLAVVTGPAPGVAASGTGGRALAWSGLVLLALAAVTSAGRVRAALSYEAWWTVHLGSYVAVAASLRHQVTGSTLFGGRPVLQALWVGLHVAVAAAVLTYRLGVPVRRSLRHRLRVESLWGEPGAALSVLVAGRGLAGLRVRGGQFVVLRVLRRGMWAQGHPYSVSLLPRLHPQTGREVLRLTMSTRGDFGAAMAFVPPRTRVVLEGPYGTFTAGQVPVGAPVLVVAHAMGACAARSLLQDLTAANRPVLLLCAADPDSALFGEELRHRVEQLGGRVVLRTAADCTPQAPVYGLTPGGMLAVVDDLAQRHVFVSAAAAIVDVVRTACQWQGVPADRLHVESMAW